MAISAENCAELRNSRIYRHFVETDKEMNHDENRTPRNKVISTTKIQPTDESVAETASVDENRIRDSESSTIRKKAGRTCGEMTENSSERIKNVRRSSETAVEVDKSQLEIGITQKIQVKCLLLLP
jgi:hypothetical protein